MYSKSFIVHFFHGAPAICRHEAHEYSDAEIEEVLGRVFCQEIRTIGPRAGNRTITKRVAPEIQGMEIAETKRFFIPGDSDSDDENIVVHRIR
jgi:hypothetical protein